MLNRQEEVWIYKGHENKHFKSVVGRNRKVSGGTNNADHDGSQSTQYNNKNFI